jgi:molybdopterin synthase catalytic subunit
MKLFTEGPIDHSTITKALTLLSHDCENGAHEIFLGQVRCDRIDGHHVVAIEYSAFEEMVEEQLKKITDQIFDQFPIKALHIRHSLGLVPAGSISLFVLISAPHRQAAFDATRSLIDRIKAELPIWGKEIFDNQHSQWKVNR